MIRLLGEGAATARAFTLVAAAPAAPGPAERDPAVILPGQEWASAEQLARRFGRSTKWVRARRVQLGAARISESPNSQLAFHVATADEYMRSLRLEPEPQPRARRRRPRADAGRTPGGAPRQSFGRGG